MEKEEVIYLDYETIGAPQIRQLLECSQALSKALTADEFFQIMSVYRGVVDRLSSKLPENKEANSNAIL